MAQDTPPAGLVPKGDEDDDAPGPPGILPPPVAAGKGQSDALVHRDMAG